ncbi:MULTISPECIES: aspartate/glutamate racemase family protein [unclassified Variovorax]|uniref:aspartate/glutamate racemase family protein n=1 Tax=unclassified Variovorax TaxID=663243 RepID=UPI0025761859|nr:MULTISPECIES: aspartate/glutamate racemase family protein [unclassified Variovorax]MDM0089989.1 aspartate/glutamate racemase family protein [Variovorax sp. J22G40]MDM0148345.1 aspartate/glutamate racemase family protein [Variovorax sp. J2P1-31]
MKPIVLLINPNTSRETTAMMHAIARRALPPAFALESETAARGARMITTVEELAISVEEVLAIGRRRAAEVGAIVVAAYGDPGLEALRASVSIPVFGIGEASMREGALGGRRFGIATTTPDLGPAITAAVDRLGLTHCFTGCRIPPGDPLALAADPALQDAYLAEAVALAIQQDGAQAVVIGGGPLAESAERIAGRFAVPVIAPVGAAMRMAAAALQA